MEELSVFLGNPDFNINVVQDNLTAIKFALEIGKDTWTRWLREINFETARMAGRHPLLTRASEPVTWQRSDYTS